uniref:Uncharacterized protein n=1 Tax=Strigamia maritima TaxID=126957 RepID=T1IIZ8_STRMM
MKTISFKRKYSESNLVRLLDGFQKRFVEIPKNIFENHTSGFHKLKSLLRLSMTTSYIVLMMFSLRAKMIMILFYRHVTQHPLAGCIFVSYSLGKNGMPDNDESDQVVYLSKTGQNRNYRHAIVSEGIRQYKLVLKKSSLAIQANIASNYYMATSSLAASFEFELLGLHNCEWGFLEHLLEMSYAGR